MYRNPKSLTEFLSFHARKRNPGSSNDISQSDHLHVLWSLFPSPLKSPSKLCIHPCPDFLIPGSLKWSSSFLEKRGLKNRFRCPFSLRKLSVKEISEWSSALGILTAAEICCCPFDMSSENFSRQCTHLHCPVKKTHLEAFHRILERGTLWVSMSMRVGGTEGTLDKL